MYYWFLNVDYLVKILTIKKPIAKPPIIAMRISRTESINPENINKNIAIMNTNPIKVILKYAAKLVITNKAIAANISGVPANTEINHV